MSPLKQPQAFYEICKETVKNNLVEKIKFYDNLQLENREDTG